MAYNTTWASAIELSGEARMAYEEWSSHAPLSAWFPTYSNPGLTFSFDRRDPEVTEVADYREYDAENTKGNGRVKTKIIGTLPPLGRDYRVEEYEQILLYADDMKAESLRTKLIEYARFGGEKPPTKKNICRTPYMNCTPHHKQPFFLKRNTTHSKKEMEVQI